MKKLAILLIIITLLLSACGNKDTAKSDNQNTTPSTESSTLTPKSCYDVQIGNYMEKTHFYRIYGNGSIKYMQRDGDWGNLAKETPKGFDNIDFDNKSTKVGFLINAKLNSFYKIIDSVINDKNEKSACDVPMLYIYHNDKAYEYCVLHEEDNYKLFDKLFSFLNKNTSVKLDREIY